MNAMTTDEVEAAVRSLCIAQQTNLGIEISMPVVLPDGDFVNVTVAEDGDWFLVHDGSSAVMSLAAVGAKTGHDAQKRFSPLALRFGCEISGDRVMRRVERKHVGVAVVMVANAARSIADIALEMRRRVEHDFKTIVAEKVREIAGSRARFNQEVKGASGRIYHVHNLVLDKDMKHPIAYIESLATRAAVSQHFTEFYDLHQVGASLKLASIYDENSDIRDSDTRLLGNVSDVYPYAQAATQVGRLLAEVGNA